MADPVVVGVDGSPGATRAVVWASDEARRRDLPLRLVHALAFVPTELPLDGPPSHIYTKLRQAADHALGTAEELARRHAPGTDVTTAVVSDAAAAVLDQESAHASLLVVGPRGHGGFVGLLLGSVVQHVVTHARCPVVVVRDQPRDGSDLRLGDAGQDRPRSGVIVVGVDSDADEALRFGFEEAATRRAVLRAVHCWSPPIPLLSFDPPLPAVEDTKARVAEESRHLDEQVRRWRGRYPGVEVEPQVVPGVPANELVAASAGAGLVVVAASRHPHRLGRSLGPVVHGLLRHSHCPVAIVTQDREP